MSNKGWDTLKSNLIQPYCDFAIRRPFDSEARASEILTTVYLRSRGLSPENLNDAWLKSTIRGEVKKTYRKGKNQPQPLESETIDASDSVLDRMCHWEEIVALQEFLPELNEKQRQALFTLFPMDGHHPTESEVAERFGIRESRVRQIRGETIALLRKKFFARGFTSDNNGGTSCR
jgi:RNA polymerase sigma factor (sigma-70 family)